MNELYSIRTIEDENSLQHYGVLGMKWGVRRNRSNRVEKKNDRRRKKQELASMRSAYRKSLWKFNKASDHIDSVKPSIYTLAMEKRPRNAFDRKKFQSEINDYLDAAEALQKNAKTYKEAKKMYKAERNAGYKFIAKLNREAFE